MLKILLHHTFARLLNIACSSICSDKETLPPVKHVKYGGLETLIRCELTVCCLGDENISQASKNRSLVSARLT